MGSIYIVLAECQCMVYGGKSKTIQIGMQVLPPVLQRT